MVYVDLSTTDVAFFRLATDEIEGIDKYRNENGRLPLQRIEWLWQKDPKQRYTTLLCSRVSEWPKLGFADDDGVHTYGGSIIMGFTLAGLIYGAMHLLAWNAPFKTAAEMLLWRGSALVLASSGPLLLLSIVFGSKGTWLPIAALAYMIFMFMAVLYVMARVFLVAECFIELFHLPEAVFQMPQWLRYWPHIA